MSIGTGNSLHQSTGKARVRSVAFGMRRISTVRSGRRLPFAAKLLHSNFEHVYRPVRLPHCTPGYSQHLDIRYSLASHLYPRMLRLGYLLSFG